MAMILPTRDDINAGIIFVLEHEDWIDADKAPASDLPRSTGFVGMVRAALKQIQKNPAEATMWMLLWSAFAVGWCAAHLSVSGRGKVN